MDMKTGKVYEGKGRIEWLAEEKDKGNWIHSLGMEKIYRLQVKKRKPRELPDYMLSWLNNGFLLIKVVERNVKHPELEKILEEYKRPVFLDVDGCGTFELEKQYGWFSGDVDWLGEECSVSLECDEEGGVTADKALEVFYLMHKNLKEWDKSFREFAASKLTDLANDWLQDEDEEDKKKITKEEFEERIRISELVIRPSGNYDAYYYDDDMFWGHIIVINGNAYSGMEDADIAG